MMTICAIQKGDEILPVNYRRSCLTSVVNKLMKTIIRDKLVSFIEENMISNTQHGFCNKCLFFFFNDSP